MAREGAEKWPGAPRLAHDSSASSAVHFYYTGGARRGGGHLDVLYIPIYKCVVSVSLCEVDTQRQLFPEQTALDSETMRNYCNTSFVKRILRCFNRTVPWVQMALGMGRGHDPFRFIVLLLIEGAKRGMWEGQ